MRLLNGCFHSFRKNAYFTINKYFKSVLGKWTCLKGSMQEERKLVAVLKTICLLIQLLIFFIHHSWWMEFSRREQHTALLEYFQAFFV